MNSRRVFRSARVLPESILVRLPDPRHADREGLAGEAEWIANAIESDVKDCVDREAELKASLDEMRERLERREREHAEELTRARAEGEHAVREAVEKFAGAAKDLMAQREDLFLASEETVVRLAVAVARRIVGDAVQVDEALVLETVRRALRLVTEKESVVLRVNPEDLKIVREHGSDWLAILEGTRSLEIVEDGRVRRGGCLVETEAGNVEAQLEKQLQTLEKALVERVR
ncbi:MAG: hypothetical protein JW958_11425 [Candidatus Eisenbacteria bacterium]|nr:hypothetical protein [Candidatus Eisenbacteria bacterium]